MPTPRTNRFLPCVVTIVILLLVQPTLSAAQKKLRVGFGDNRTVPAKLLKADDLVCIPGDLGLGADNPRIKLTKFIDTSKMTPPAIAQRRAEGFTWICYDNENGKDWKTPGEELDDPTKYTILAAKLAHDAGMKFIAEPNFELIVGRGTRGDNGKVTLTDKPIHAEDMTRIAPHLDAISLQLQRAQADLPLYVELTRKYAGQLRAANPNVIIFVQVTSRAISGKPSSPAELMKSIEAVKDFVDGIWIHIDKDKLDWATELVTLMNQAGLH